MTESIVSVTEQRLALAVQAAELGSWTWDMASGRTVWDERLEEMHGLEPGGFGGTFEDWVAALHPGDRDACIARVEAALADPGPYILVHRTTWPDGSIHTIECRGTVLVDDDGRPVGTTGVAIDVTTREQLVQKLQQALLPRALPKVAGTKIAARYRASEGRTEIGGDWYAVIALPDERLSVAIGDVAGHGLEAVADMASVRFALRALALTEPQPEVVLDRLNQVVKVFESDVMITALYGILDPRERTWTYASAGHVPAVVRSPDGTTWLLDDDSDPPLGAAATFRTRHVELPERASLVLYTDGLVERRTRSINDGLARLQQACATADPEPDALCNHILDAMLEDRANEDDVAIVAVTLD